MKNSTLENAKKFALPLSLVLAASLGGVLLMGGQSVAPANAATEAPRILPAAEVASFKPFADDAGYKPSILPQPPQTVYVSVSPQAPVAAPVTATPVYGNITEAVRPVYEETAPSDAKTQTAAPLALTPQTTSSAGTITAGDDATITANTATITVGSAVINVLSSFKLNYGGKTVLTGNNGQTTVP